MSNTEHMYIVNDEFQETVCIHVSCYKRYKREGWRKETRAEQLARTGGEDTPMPQKKTRTVANTAKKTAKKKSGSKKVSGKSD